MWHSNQLHGKVNNPYLLKLQVILSNLSNVSKMDKQSQLIEIH